MGSTPHVVHRGGKSASAVIDTDKLRELFSVTEEAEGMTAKEIAAQLGIHHATANKKLKELLDSGRAVCTGHRKVKNARGGMHPTPVYVFNSRK